MSAIIILSRDYKVAQVSSEGKIRVPFMLCCIKEYISVLRRIETKVN